MSRIVWRAMLPVLIVASAVQAEAAPYQQRINASHAAVPAKGSNASVVMIETPARAYSGEWSPRHFAPVRDNPQFKGVDIRVDATAKASNHSDTVAQLLFGSRRSIAKGIDTVYVFHSANWLGRLSRWDLDPDHISELFPAPIVNHSHVARPRIAGKMLRRADYSALSNNILHVAGVRRSGPGDPIMAGGYNSLVVGGAVENIATPYPPIDDLYGEGRARPHLVGPFPHASAAAPIAAAAAVRLNAMAAKKRLIFPTTARSGSEQLPVELVKAILIASASGDFEFTLKNEVLVNSFGTLGVTANGLDKRYGMGMLNVGNAEDILSAVPGPVAAVSTCSSDDTAESSGPMPGAQQSAVVMSSACPSTESGYTFHSGLDGAGEGAGFRVRPSKDGTLTASLVWLADLQRDGAELTGRVYDFDLRLIDQQAGSAPVAESVATFDTLENIRVPVRRDRTYQLVVTRKGEHSTPWPFALAWRLSP